MQRTRWRPAPRLLTFSRLNSTNLPAFQSLFVKLRAELTRSRLRGAMRRGVRSVSACSKSTFCRLPACGKRGSRNRLAVSQQPSHSRPWQVQPT